MASMVILLHGHATFIFLLFLSISSDLSAAEIPPPEPKQHTKIITHQKQQMTEPAFTMQRDTIQINNPTTPGTDISIIDPVSPLSPLVSTPSGSCYNPNTLRDDASYAFNDYNQKNPVATSCVFGGTTQVTFTNPSQGSCQFGNSRSSTTVTPPNPFTPTPVTPTPITPMVDTPTTSIHSPFYATPITPYGDAEPTESPNSAISTKCSLLVLTTSGLLASVTADYL